MGKFVDELDKVDTWNCQIDGTPEGVRNANFLTSLRDMLRPVVGVLELACEDEIERATRLIDREVAASAVPTNWCDPLLTGPEAPKGEAWGSRDIECLLHGIQDRIRAL